jgi:hypothetical protein
MSNLKIEKHCLKSWHKVGMCDFNVNVFSCCKLAERVDPWFRNSAELRHAMCNVGWPEAVMCCPSVAMLVSVTLLLSDCPGGGT